MKKEEKLNEQRKIDSEDIAAEANKLTFEDKERIYFMMKGMQLSKGVTDIQEVMQRA